MGRHATQTGIDDAREFLGRSSPAHTQLDPSSRRRLRSPVPDTGILCFPAPQTFSRSRGRMRLSRLTPSERPGASSLPASANPPQPPQGFVLALRVYPRIADQTHAPASVVGLMPISAVSRRSKVRTQMSFTQSPRRREQGARMELLAQAPSLPTRHQPAAQPCRLRAGHATARPL
jgi:hypothetical protein